MGPDGADQVISWIASQEGLIIVTYDRDFRTAARRIAPEGSKKPVQRRAPVIWLHISEPEAQQRLEACFAYIEQHFATAREAGFHIELCEVTPDRVNFRVGTPRR